MKRILTKEMLINWGVEVIRENGVDTIYQRRLKPAGMKKLELRDEKSPSTYKDQLPYKYVLLARYDEEKIYKYGKWAYKYDLFAAHRVIYAWYNGFCPEDLDIDHLDNNRENNNYENLTPITRKENNGKKKVSRNQWNYWMTDEEILEKRKEKAYIYDRQTEKIIKNPDLIKE